eukprot:m.355191 g.355191  ORF g.355191 m.355191 type:complete len:457 (+) comp17195_c0_seq1:342-1712(+)
MAFSEREVTMATQEFSLPQFTCLTCRVGFPDGDIQRAHYKTDWHRYNLKRKVATLAPVSANAFRERVLAQRRDQEEQQAKEATNFVCEPCGKTFNTQGSHDSHMKSKKHKERCAKVAQAQKRKAEAQAVENATAEDTGASMEMAETPVQVAQPIVSATVSVSADVEQDAEDAVPAKNRQDVEEQKRKYVLLRKKMIAEYEAEQARKSGAMDASADGDEAPTEGQDNGEDDEEPILELFDCVFDTYRADNLEDLIAYMSKEHCFFIPNIEYVVDLEGLLRYLQLKVGNYFTCLACHKGFHSLEAVRNHMSDKSHKAVDYTEDGQAELGDFYDYSSTYPDDAELDDAARDMDLAVIGTGSTLKVDGMELVLPDGKRIGHREMKHYYKQRFRKEDTRESVVISRLAAQYKALGHSGFTAPAPLLRRDQARADRKTKRNSLGTALKQNRLQFHYREQVLV